MTNPRPRLPPVINATRSVEPEMDMPLHHSLGPQAMAKRNGDRFYVRRCGDLRSHLASSVVRTSATTSPPWDGAEEPARGRPTRVLISVEYLDRAVSYPDMMILEPVGDSRKKLRSRSAPV